MSITANIKIDVKDIAKMLPKAQAKFAKLIRKPLEREILQSIKRGVSPVKGQKRFKAYSDLYKNKIKKKIVRGQDGAKYPDKRARPVTLSVSNEMLDSLKITVISKGVNVEFTNELAEKHNRGLGIMPKRQLLPTESGQQFNRNISEVIQLRANKALKETKGGI